MKTSLLSMLFLFLCACSQERTEQPDLANLLGSSDSQGYLRAETVRTFSFPTDHGAHDGFRNEWWYFTGHLQTNAGREFGYQLTFFRIAVKPQEPLSASHWKANVIWMVHVAISDLEQSIHYQDQRYSREALGLAGVKDDPLEIWVEDWKISGGESNKFPWQVTAATEAFSLDLKVSPIKPEVLQGNNGLSRKGSEPGNASYYYSVSRLETTGHVSIGDRQFSVRGLSWLDREWSTSVLADDQQGWDWFSLQLKDGRDMMFYQIRKKSGESDVHSAGTLIDKKGVPRTVARNDVVLEPLRYWKSLTGARYPVSWTMRVKGESGTWKISALFDEQEMRTAVNYWEGAVEVTDQESGQVLGKGYLEMTGY